MNAKLACGKDELDRDWNDLDIFAIDPVVGSPPMGSTGLVGFGQRLAPNRDCFRSEGLVRVIHGARDLFLPVAGMPVGEVRTFYRTFLNFRRDAHAFIGGERVGDDHVIRSGEALEFLFPYGCKGVGLVWSREEFCEHFRLSEAQFQELKNRGLPVHVFTDGAERITETDFDLWSTSCLGLNSPWLTTEQAAAYLHTTVKGVYGKVERGELEKGRGNLYNSEMLDAYVLGRAARRRKK